MAPTLVGSLAFVRAVESEPSKRANDNHKRTSEKNQTAKISSSKKNIGTPSDCFKESQDSDSVSGAAHFICS